jgi:FG-GAP-like repeat/Abnormal spindle-like microcephaly-assoc'd, ASPM-SPD-2-Hydin
MSVRYKSVGIGLLLLLFAFGPLRVFGQTPNPIPLINMPLMPAGAAPGGAGFKLTINGTGFVSNSVASWNGSPRTTTFINDSQVTATIPASDIANAGTASIMVTNPSPGGGISNVMYFTVTDPVSTLQFAVFDSPAQSGPLVAADFNGDGKIDLAIGAMNFTGVCIELGVGDGTFQSPICLSQTTPVISAIAADFNGDGRLDLAGVDADSVHVWLGNGDGTFQPEKDFDMPTNGGNEEIAFAAGDFNHDGKLDLVVGNGSTGGVSILLGNGDGTFQNAGNHAAENFSAAIGDFNHDGNLDVVAGGTLFLGNGDGTFQAPESIPILDPGIEVIAADVNGDGNLDLIYTGSGTGLYVLLGNGDGTFQPPGNNLDSNSLIWMAAADFNGDGKLDLAVTNDLGASGNSNSILLGNGDGTFQSPIQLPSVGLYSLVSADFNGDGKTDLAGVADEVSGLDLSILLQGAWPALTPSLSELAFDGQPVGTTSAPQTVTLTNTGTSALTISNLAITGANASEFAQTNTCGSTLASNASCQVSVTFSPTAITGGVTPSLTISDDALGSPQVISLTGSTPPGAVVAISPASVSFPSQYVGTSGLPQKVTLTNTGTGTLAITNITTSPSDFGNLSGCGNSLAAGASCQIGIFFDPTSGGTRTGTLTITDNAADSPQTVSVSGMGQDFSVTPTSASTTVSPGQSASYMVSVSPAGGFAQSVSLSCSGAPATSNCSISPSTISLNGSSPTMATVMVTTTGSNGLVLPLGSGWPRSVTPRRTPSTILACTGAFILFAVMLLRWRGEHRLRWTRTLGLTLLVCVGMALTSCGGGSGSGGGGSGTQAGTYTLTVTGNFNSGSTNLTHLAKLTLVVK